MASQEHVWLIVAYTRDPSSAHPGLTLYRHDDANGPYLKVDDPWNETWSAHSPWSQALLPLPPKIYMTAEYAEEVGRWWFGLRAKGGDPGINSLADMIQGDRLSFMIYGVDSSQYKFGLAGRSGFDGDVAREYRLSSWPRNLWVVEAIDRKCRAAGEDCVVGEVIIDPTANHYPSEAEPGIIAAHAPGLLWLRSPDRGIERKQEVSRAAYESGRPTYEVA